MHWQRTRPTVQKCVLWSCCAVHKHYSNTSMSSEYLLTYARSQLVTHSNTHTQYHVCTTINVFNLFCTRIGCACQSLSSDGPERMCRALAYAMTYGTCAPPNLLPRPWGYAPLILKPLPQAVQMPAMTLVLPELAFLFFQTLPAQFTFGHTMDFILLTPQLAKGFERMSSP